MIDLKALKAKTDLRALVTNTEARIRFGRYDLVVCPFHVDDTPSLLVYPDWYQCQACHARGDVYNWYQNLEGISFKEAVRRVINAKPAQNFQQTKREIVRIKQNLGMTYHLQLTKDVMEYYKNKLGFAVQTVQKFQLGYGCLPNKPYPRFTIPFYQNGELVNIKARRDDRCPNCKNWNTTLKREDKKVLIECVSCGDVEHPDPDPLQKYTQIKGGKQILFNSDDLLGWKDGVLGDNPFGSVMLTEGEYKAIAVCQAGHYAVSFGGSSTFNQTYAEMFLAATTITMIVDNDPPNSNGERPGWLAAMKVRSFLPHTRLVLLPNEPKGDVVDFLRDFGPEEFFRIVNNQMHSKINNVDLRLMKGLLNV